ncbi:MAG: hypothetical protein HGA30_06755 [Anaerolineales bacterium]|jgi:hypothetical protein|nr:hypothetical protein [Anaerolineales bacterium]
MSTNQVLEQMSQTTAENTRQTRRTPFTHQTGQVLVAFGMLFKHVPPFNETIDESTGETLISIGRKLISAQES